MELKLSDIERDLLRSSLMDAMVNSPNFSELEKNYLQDVYHRISDWEEERHKRNKFYKGQKVKIINDTCSHGIPIGSIVVLENAKYKPKTKEDDTEWDLWFEGMISDEDDCEPL